LAENRFVSLSRHSPTLTRPGRDKNVSGLPSGKQRSPGHRNSGQDRCDGDRTDVPGAL